ncbi:MAG: ATP-binding protein [Vicinamibacteria bacterium]|jgi:DNA helicase HerA-like ATPase|nr:ATP-binding protein [Vicinamibacteria bacterium]
MTSSPAGRVLGSVDATPLEFWIGVPAGGRVQLDDLVCVETALDDGSRVRFFGVVDVVRKRYEGQAFDSDAFRHAEGTLPVDVSYAAHVAVTRIEPEVFVPPHPGDAARIVEGAEFEQALYFDRMAKKIAIGLTRSGEPVYANLEFLDGTRGAHLSISGVSGVATKTSYASFLLYSLFHSDALGADAANTKALVFNVKGEDLLWLDRPNARLDEKARAGYAKLGLPAGPFQSVGLYAPAGAGSTPMPDVGSRQEGVRPYLWTLRELCEQRLLRFAFADAEDARGQLGFVVERVEAELARLAKELPKDEAGIVIEGVACRTFEEFVEAVASVWLDNLMARGSFAAGTLDAFRRRLFGIIPRLAPLVRGDASASQYPVSWASHQVTVVDIHKLHATAQMFVVGVLLKKMMAEREQRGSARPLVFVVLDELNKYAPREGWSPIRDLIRDIAERGRSLGVCLMGAQQTASEVEKRVIANAAIKVVGRLDAAESERAEYGFLSKVARLRSNLLQPGTMIVSQPEIPTPVLLGFPFPSWATRADEAAAPPPDPAKARRDLFSRVK